MNKKEMNNKGFSLVELIIVIAIMAILVGVLAPQFIKYVEQSRESTDLQNIEEYKTAVEAAVADGAFTTATITVSGSTTKTISCNQDLSEYGLPAAGVTSSLKSAEWPATSEYKYENFKWTNPSGHAKYYNLDGSKVTP